MPIEVYLLLTNPVVGCKFFQENLNNTPGTAGMSPLTPQAMIVHPKTPWVQWAALNTHRITRWKNIENFGTCKNFLSPRKFFFLLFASQTIETAHKTSQYLPDLAS